ncbi:MAG: hypothetical protein ACYDBV_11180 [Nitrospiria bacterium]
MVLRSKVKKRIIIDVIPHKLQRYNTCGDWIFDKKGNLHISVSDMGNDDYAFLVGIHEAVEAWLCRDRNIDERKITDFDLKYEALRKENDFSEPGDDPQAPYCQEHLFATGIEKLLCSALNIKWAEYDKAVNDL